MIEFRDRDSAGEMLAEELTHCSRKFDLIIGLPRGGVSVALPIARRLKIPLDLLIVKKLGAPGQPELALGAIASGGYIYINHELCRKLEVGRKEFAGIQLQASRELLAREDRLLGGKRREVWAGRHILLVDDGIATGATMEVALRAIKARHPTSISIAVPVASQASLQRFQPRVDLLYALHRPTFLGAVGEFYQSFPQVSDQEVRETLQQLEREERASHDLATRS